MLRNKGEEIESRALAVHKEKQTRKIVPIILSAIAVLLVIIYLISVMYTRFGSFTISVNKYEQLRYGLSLSESATFNKAYSNLDARASQEITNISKADLPDDQLGVNDGLDNGKNYMCYTFYVKNTGQEDISFDYSMNIVTMTLNIEKAVRIRIKTNYNGENPTSTDYARAKYVDDQGNVVPEEDTTPFFAKAIIMQSTVNGFKVGDIMKFTIVLWLEGPDEDCVDGIIGGEFKIEMKFSVSHIDE